MGLVEELLGGDWAVDELPERDGWTFEADDCMAPAWDAPGSGGGASSAGAASPWWALAADEENVAVAALVQRDVKIEAQEQDEDALLVEKALAAHGAVISPVPKQQTREAPAKGAFSLLLSEDSQADSGNESARTGTTDTSSTTSSVKASPLAEHGPVDVKPGRPKAKAAAGKKPRRRAGSTGTASKVPGKAPGKAPTELAWDERNLTPLEIRRKRNRESMQRARRRQRDDIEQMKETLMQLEQQYQALSEASVERRKQGAEASASASPKLEADYYALADLSHVLKEEKFMLERMLTDKQKTYRRFQQVMVDRRDELELPCPTTTSDTSLFSDFEFAPMTEHQVNEHIRNCYQHIRHVEETAKPFTSRQFAEIEDSTSGKPTRRYSTGSPMSMMGGAEFEPGCPIPPSATFGWKVMCESTPSGDFLVSFSKFFRGVTAQEAMINSWQRTQDPKKHSSPFRRHVRHEVLQVINDSAYITGVDIEHPVLPDKFMRAHNLNFRMQTERGFVIGRYSVNPMSREARAALERDSPFEYVDSCNWVEFATQHDEETGEEGVNVKFIASTEYNTQEDMYVRLVNSIARTMIWEYSVIPCPMTLLPS